MSRTKINTHKKAMEQRERMRLKRERIAGLRALMLSWEKAGDLAEARRVGTRIRLAEQELRYMGDDDTYLTDVEFNGTGTHL